MVLLASIELIFLDHEGRCLLCIHLFHVFKSTNLSIVSLFAQVGPPVLHMVVLLSSDLLISNGEILIEALLLTDEVARGGIWVMNLSRVDEFMVTACSLTESRVLDQFFIFHSSLEEKEEDKLADEQRDEK